MKSKKQKIILVIEILLVALIITSLSITCICIDNMTLSTTFIIVFLTSIILEIITHRYSKLLKEEKIKDLKIENNYIYYDEDNDKPNLIKVENSSSKYHIKEKTISDSEMYFYNIIKKHFGDKYDIRAQVPLSSVIEKEKDFERQYQNELYRSIDIGIFDLKTTAPLLLIEINDRTHHNKDRKARDNKVKEICNNAGLPLLTFWTEYSNTEKYIINRVRENLER